MEQRSPRNTAAETKADPLTFLAASLGPGGTSQAITEQERAGQAEMVASTVVPTDLSFSTREEFEALGFVFGDEVPGDPMFRDAQLPAGWGRAGSNHDMWSHIVDDRGIERVAVFYKAAFYDRSAHMDILNVGSQIATKHIYGDAKTFTLDARLTADEIEQLRGAAESYTERAEEHPDIYGDRVARAWQILDALPKA